MKILAIYPGLNLEVNEFAYVMQHLAELGHQVTVITAQQNPMKAVQQSVPFEEIGRLQIHRTYKSFTQMIYWPQLHARRVRAIAQEMRPDVIFCSQEYNMKLAKMIQKRVDAPIVLAVEDAGRIARGEFPGKIRSKLMPLLGVPTYGKHYWRWLCQQANDIITYDPADIPHLDALSAWGTPVQYIPWCNPLPRDFVWPTKRYNRVIYIGTFSVFKNTDTLGWAIPQILEQTPTEDALLIGPGDTAVVRSLQERFGERIQYLSGCSRTEALTYLASSFFAFTTMRLGYGGFIGDAWNTNTPLVAVPDNTGLIHNQDALIPASEAQLAATVNRLFEEPGLYQALQAGGAQHAQQASVPTVAAKILKACMQVSQMNTALYLHSASATV